MRSLCSAGSYLDYLRRRLLSARARVHGVDTRGLGDPEDRHLPKELQGSYDKLRRDSGRRLRCLRVLAEALRAFREPDFIRFQQIS